MVNKELSVAYSTAGEALKKVSTVILVLSIIAIVILTIMAVIIENIIFFEIGISCLLPSLFFWALGRCVGNIADYIEAIYKGQNKDYKYDRYLLNGATYLPGDEVMYGEEKVVIIDITIESSYNKYKCQKQNGETVEVFAGYLKPIK